MKKSYTPEYGAWKNFIFRCTNPKAANFHRYGGRGIKVARRWMKFENFLADMGPRPSPKHTIDRYPDNDGDYRPGNVRWATRKEQQANTSKTRYVIINGTRVPFCAAYQSMGMKKETALARIRLGWTPQQVIDRPWQTRKSIPAKVRAQIKKAVGSQDAIALRFGVAQSSVSSIKRGE